MIVVATDTNEYASLCVAFFTTEYGDLRHLRRAQLDAARRRVNRAVTSALMSGAVWQVAPGLWAYRDEGILGVRQLVEHADPKLIELFYEDALRLVPLNN